METSAEVGLKQYVEILQRRKWVIIVAFLSLVATAAVVTAMQTPIYRGIAVVMVEDGTETVGRSDELPMLSGVLEMTRGRSIETQRLLVTTRPVMEKVVEELGLEMSADKLRTKVLVETVRDTDVLEIYVDVEEAALAAEIANCVADKYIMLNQDYNRTSAKNAAAFLEEQLQIVKADLARAEEEVEDYKKHVGIADIDKETQEQVSVLGETERELARATAEAMATTARSRVIQEKLSEQERLQLRAITEAPNMAVENLQAELAGLESRRAGLLVEYAAESNKVRAADAQIEELRQRLAEQLRAELVSTTQSANPTYDELLVEAARSSALAVAADHRVAALQKATRQFEDKLTALPSRQKELTRLVRAQEVASRIYTLLLEKYHEVRIAQAMKLANVRLIEPAEAPKFPIKPRKVLNLALAGVFGLVLGLVLASLVEYFDDTVRTPEELAQILEVPVLGEVPHFRQEDSAPVGTEGYPGPKAEAFRTIYSNLRFASFERPIRSVIITSAVPGEGKTFIAANLALAIASAGKQVIVVDCDLRRPGLSQFFDVKNTAGLVNMLVGESDLEELLQATEVEGLRVLSSGPLPPNPLEMLSSERMDRLCKALSEHADFVIYDAPPSGVVTDAAALVSKLDGVLMVAEQAGPSSKQLVAARDLLRRARGRIIGSILNKTKKGESYYHYYYYYRSDESDRAA